MITHETDIDQIVKVIQKSDLSPSTVPEIVNWYQYAFEHGMVHTERDSDGNFGFIDWVRIPVVPKSVKEAREIFNEVQEGPIMMVLSCYADTPKLMWKLKKAAIAKNPDHLVLVWHSKKRDKMKYYKNRGKR